MLKGLNQKVRNWLSGCTFRIHGHEVTDPLQKKKTTIAHINEGFNFLGQNVRKYGGKLLIKPSKKNLKSFLNKVRSTIEANKTVTAAKLITSLNPMIRGWANYHRHKVAKDAYNCADHHIWQKIWRWCRRRHPNKGRYRVATKGALIKA